MTLAHRMLRSPGRSLLDLATAAAVLWTAVHALPDPLPRTESDLRFRARQLTATDSYMRRALIAFAAVAPRTPLRIQSADIDRQAAAEALEGSPPAALALVGELAQGLRAARSPGARDALARTLQRVGEPALGHLLPLTADASPEVRQRALRIVVSILEAQGPAIQHPADLATVLAFGLNPSPETGLEPAVHALALLGPDARVAIAALVALAPHPSVAIRVAVADALGRISGRPADSVPVLVRLLMDPSEEVRRSAASGLGRFGASAREAVPALAQATRDRSLPAAVAAITALGRIGRTADAALPELTAGLVHPQSVLRAASATALGRMAADSPEAVAALALALKDDDGYVRRQSILALKACGLRAAPAVPALIAALRDPLESVHIEAVEALGIIGPPAASAIPHLQAARNNNQSVMSQPVLAALARIEGRPDPGLLASER